MKRILILSIALLITACVSPEQVAAKKARQQAMMNAINQNSVVVCDNKKKCDAIYRVAVDMVTSYADMKIQTQGENNISTYNPIDWGRIGMGARRTLNTDNTENITLNVYCKGMLGDYPWEACFDQVTFIYNTYKTKVASINDDKKDNLQKRNKSN